MDVACLASELEEYGQTVSVGDRIDRLATRPLERVFAEHPSVRWLLDRYALLSGAPHARIEGEVRRIFEVRRITGDEGARHEFSEIPRTTRHVHGIPDARATPMPDGRGGFWTPMTDGPEEHVGWVFELTDAR